MQTTQIPENILFFEARARDVRLRNIHLLSKRELKIKQIADRNGISSPIMLKHIKKLEDAGFVTTRLEKRDGSLCKICTLIFAEYRLGLDFRRRGLPMSHCHSIPVGSYCLIEGTPTCGLAVEKGLVGPCDDPRVFWETERFNAQLLWFTQGYVEYRWPNYLTPAQKILEIELSFEIASEAPDYAEIWPSDITFGFNGTTLFSWTSPGDYGVKRGKLTPEWWLSNQYGLLKTMRLTRDGVYLDEQKVSDIPLDQLTRDTDKHWSLRFEVPEDAENVGGLTLFGKKFGNHAQDIMVRTFWEAT